MATYKGRHVLVTLFSGGIRIVPFSGTVKNSSDNGIERDILIYKHTNDIFSTTRSDSAGNFSVDVPCGSNDRLRVVAVGGEDSGDNTENSSILDNISGE